MENIQFDIVIPAYRCEAFLTACVDSVLQDNYPAVRVLLVDDGSPDSTGALCDALAAQHPQVAVLHQSNAGALAARVAGVQHFRKIGQPSDFLLCIDADDTLLPGALTVLSEAIRREGCDMVFLRANWAYPKGDINLDPIGMPNATVTDKRTLYKLLFGSTGYNPMWRKAVRLSLFTAETHREYYGMRLSEDLLQSLPLYKRCTRVTFLPDILYRYTVNLSSVTNTVRYDNFVSNNTVFRLVWQFLQEENVWNQQDYADYLAFCRVQLHDTLWIILRFQTGRRNIYRTLRTVAQEEEYRRILDTVTPKERALWLWKRNRLLPLWLLGRGFLAAGTVYHKMRGDKK